MGHATTAALTATHLVGAVATVGGVAVLYFREQATETIRTLKRR